MSPRVLLLDPPTRLSRDLERALIEAGLDVIRHTAPDAALGELLRDGFDVALGEVSIGGAEVLRASRDSTATDDPPFILFDDYGSVEEAAQARAAGAFDVLARPLPHEIVLGAVRRALEQTALQRENHDLRTAAERRQQLDDLDSADPRMRRVFGTLAAVADSDATILIAGESGVGKTRLARVVHRRSTRAARPFIEVNCGALPETLLDAELFGHKKGAFTGALNDRKGKFESAHTGTLFLDEIATATPALQVKLLRVLEDSSFEPVGDDRTRSVDVRLIVATNRDLLAEVEAGRFREDLYYRIHVVAVEVPPLRERPSDVPLLAARFVSAFAERHRRGVTGITPEALQALVRAPWPGNVRELENALERAVLLTRGALVDLEDLPPGLAPAAGSPTAGAPWEALPLGPLKRALEIPERALIVRALRHHDGSRSEAAATLGINRTTLFNKMRKYDLLSFPVGRSQAGGPDRRAAEPSDAGAE